MRFWKYLIVAAMAALPVSASAQDVKALGTFGRWIAYTYQENGKPVCFMSAKPDKSEGNYKARGEPQLLISHRPAEKAFDVVSMVAGYQYLPDSDVFITVGAKKFTLFTMSDRAWASDNQTDKAIVMALSKASSAVVKGTSNHNSATTDVVPLAGFGAAYKAIGDACKKP